MSKTPAEARADYLALLERQANDQALSPATRALAADRLAQERFVGKVDAGLRLFRTADADGRLPSTPGGNGGGGSDTAEGA